MNAIFALLVLMFAAIEGAQAEPVCKVEKQGSFKMGSADNFMSAIMYPGCRLKFKTPNNKDYVFLELKVLDKPKCGSIPDDEDEVEYTALDMDKLRPFPCRDVIRFRESWVSVEDKDEKSDVIYRSVTVSVLVTQK